MLDLSWDHIRESQEADTTLQKIFELLRDPDPPADVNPFGMGVVNLWNQRKSLEIINGVIHRNYETAEGLLLYRQILVPAPLREKFLYWVHGDPTSGHFGVQKTSDKLQRYAYWSGWRKDTELFVRRCDACCRYRKGPARPQGPMKNGVGLAPFQKFHIDLTGPHRRSSGGHVYLLTGICCFTKYLVVVPLKDKSALSVANALLKHVYLIYGAVELQVHDNGPEFVNSILAHLSRMMGIQDLRSTPYRPVANSAIERTHRTLNAIFAKTIKEHQRDWHEQAKYVCFAYNTAKHTSTTFSPFYLVFLREPRVGIDLFLDRSEPAFQDTEEYSEKVRERMQKAYQIVSDQLRVTFDRAKRRYDQRVRAVHFPLNSYVWFFCPRLTAGRGRKFRKLTDGPFRIVRILNDVNYVIQKTPGARLQICHVDRLLRYEGEIPTVWLKFDQESQTEQPDRDGQPRNLNPESNLSNSDGNGPIKGTCSGPKTKKGRSIKLRQFLSTGGATLSHKLASHQGGGAKPRLAWAGQAKEDYWANGPEVGPVGHLHSARQPADNRRDYVNSGYPRQPADNQPRNVIFSPAGRRKTIKEKRPSTNVIYQLTFKKSSSTMAKKNISKEFIDSSDDSELSEGEKVSLGFHEPDTTANRDCTTSRTDKASSSRSSKERHPGPPSEERSGREESTFKIPKSQKPFRIGFGNSQGRIQETEPGTCLRRVFGTTGGTIQRTVTSGEQEDHIGGRDGVTSRSSQPVTGEGHHVEPASGRGQYRSSQRQLQPFRYHRNETKLYSRAII